VKPDPGAHFVKPESQRENLPSAERYLVVDSDHYTDRDRPQVSAALTQPWLLPTVATRLAQRVTGDEFYKYADKMFAAWHRCAPLSFCTPQVPAGARFNHV
jgi:hypothetical protein